MRNKIKNDTIFVNNSIGEPIQINLEFYPPDFISITQGDHTIEVHDLVDFILKLQQAETEGTRRAMEGRC